MRELCAAISDTMVRQSKSLGTCGIHAVSSPADSAHPMSETSLATLRAISPRSAPIITPMRTDVSSAGSGVPVSARISRTRTSSGVPVGNTAAAPACNKLGHVGVRDRPADDDGDVGGIGGAQRFDGARGQRQVRTRQDAQADDGHVFLDRDRRDVLDALPDAGVDDLESGVAQCARDDLGAAVVPVETGLGDQNTNGHQNTTGCRNSPHTALSAETISPTVQYALAQSISLCIRLSFPSAARDNAARLDSTAAESLSAFTLESRLSCRSRPSASSS